MNAILEKPALKPPAERPHSWLRAERPGAPSFVRNPCGLRLSVRPDRRRP
ncbi:MAG: hypothetical protein WC969_03530 [Elusimicrobiota bacterium]